MPEPAESHVWVLTTRVNLEATNSSSDLVFISHNLPDYLLKTKENPTNVVWYITIFTCMVCKKGATISVARKEA